MTVALRLKRPSAYTGPGLSIAVVGPCASGKTSLVRGLRNLGFNAREVAQEHSCVPHLWCRFSRPALLVYLDVSPGVACRRRGMASPPSWWSSAAGRLRHARRQADLCIETDQLTPDQILDLTVSFLKSEP